MSSMRDSQFRRPDIGTIGASLLVMVGFAVYLAGRYLGSLPGYQYNGPIPPDIAYSIMGFYSAIVGIVILTARFLWQVFALPARGRIALLAGWSLVIAGLVAMPTGALQETTCSNCYFNLNGSFVIFWAGAVALPAGLTVVASVLLASQSRPPGHKQLVRIALAAVVIILAGVTLWTAFEAYSAYLSYTSLRFNLAL